MVQFTVTCPHLTTGPLSCVLLPVTKGCADGDHVCVGAALLVDIWRLLKGTMLLQSILNVFHVPCLGQWDQAKLVCLYYSILSIEEILIESKEMC